MLRVMYEDEDFFAEVIEQAYLEAQIDGDQQDLAYLWLRTNYQDWEH